jgi:ATP-dependent exoDNAse (exonuclease V) beta subunit
MALDLLTWSKFNCYTFYESEHKYYCYGKPVAISVTKFIDQFFEPFDIQEVSKKYALKHDLNQEDVVAEWKKKGKISSTTGTIIHKYLEDYARGKVFEVDYSEAIKNNVLNEVKEKVSILLPQAKKFHDDTLGKLIPIQCEYTVGIDNLIAGNIDLLCWNVAANEFQIWDYKNVKEIKLKNPWGKKGLNEMCNYDDCNYTHYSLQQNLYKNMLERKLDVKIGKCYLVHFNPEEITKIDYNIFECLDLQKECNQILDRYVMENQI